MKLVRMELSNFRGYQAHTSIDLGDLTAIVGRNDVGKSSLLDALGAFLENDLCKLDASDRCVHTLGADITISCVFSELPASLVLDDSATTSLAAEHLLDADGNLHIKKVFSGERLKEEVYAVAVHPTNPAVSDLLSKKQADLKKAVNDLKLEADLRSNVDMRRALRASVDDLALAVRDVPLSKEGGKDLWSSISTHLPIYALFRADRASTDDDGEVQDPLKVAVKAALAEAATEIARVKGLVESHAVEVATRTLRKIEAIDPALASTLAPRFKAEPKWDSMFKLSLTGDDDIPINKRGSGVRRLILLGFFQAELERRRASESLRSVIFAVEEPETSQHPANQALILEALRELSQAANTQVIITTHVPGLAGLLPTDCLRYVERTDSGKGRKVTAGIDTLKQIAADLGVLPDPIPPRVQVFLCLEGPTDIPFFERVSQQFAAAGENVPEIGKDPRVAALPLGGSTLRDWVNQQYLRELGKPEVHIYDGDKPEYKTAAATVSSRTDGSWGVTTNKREIENYYASDTFVAGMGVPVAVTDQCDVEHQVTVALGGKTSFNGLRIKRAIALHVAPHFTIDHLKNRGGDQEILGWLKRIAAMLV